MKTPLPFLALAAVALAAAGCSSQRPVRTALDCPQKVGGLTRASQAADGKSCLYQTSHSDRVELKLIPVAGSAEATLAPLEQQLQAEAGGQAKVADAGDKADVDLPGLHVRADDNSANVEIAGVHIAAAGDNAAVKVSHDVRLVGQPLSRERRGFRTTYMISRDPAVNGYEGFGYQAGGPKAGPLAVAVVHATGMDHGVFHDARKLTRRNGGV